MVLGLAGLVATLLPENRLADHDPATGVEGSPVPTKNEVNERLPGRPASDDSPDKASPGEPLLTLVGQAKADANCPLAFPVFIAVSEGDKKRIIAAGIYVPEHTREVDLSDLSPAEQHAVRQVLGIPEDQIPREPI
jgi:hypothetical protein